MLAFECEAVTRLLVAMSTGRMAAALKSMDEAAASRSNDGIIGTRAAAAKATLPTSNAIYKVALESARQASTARGLKHILMAVSSGRGVARKELWINPIDTTMAASANAYKINRPI